MRAGRLRHRLTIQSRTDGRSTTGQPVFTWVNHATVWGAVEPLSGREFESQDQQQTETKTRIVIRYTGGVTTAMRVKFGEAFYNIQTVIHRDHRNREIHLLCSEGLTDGS